MQKICSMINRVKSCIPRYAVMPLLSCLTVNMIVYYGAGIITEDWKHYNLTVSFDKVVPLIPAFVIVYLGAFIFWIINYILIMQQGKEECYRFASADILSRIFCGVIFLLLPTVNVRPPLPDQGFFAGLLQMIYSVDEPTRLFPSIHCLVSWLCFIGIRRCRNISTLYKGFTCLFAILVCVSTQVLKQHYIVDVLGGVVIAELAYWISYHTGLYKYLLYIFK